MFSKHYYFLIAISLATIDKARSRNKIVRPMKLYRVTNSFPNIELCYLRTFRVPVTLNVSAFVYSFCLIWRAYFALGDGSISWNFKYFE